MTDPMNLGQRTPANPWPRAGVDPQDPPEHDEDAPAPVRYCGSCGRPLTQREAGTCAPCWTRLHGND